MALKPINFSLYGGAIDDPETPRSIYEAIGRAAMAWARLEIHLDAIILHINKREHSEKLYREHPTSFDKKIDVVKGWFNNHPALLPHKGFMRDLTSSFKVLSKQARNPLFHSLFASYDAMRKEMTIQNLRHVGNDEFKVTVEKLSIDFVRGLYRSTNEANHLLGMISRELFTPEAVQRFRIPE